MQKENVVRIILNGKKSGLPYVRDAIAMARRELSDCDLQVRVTWEYGDVHRLVYEAVGEGVDRLIIGGGDGSVNEVIDALASISKEKRPPVGVLPLGTANDFASGCNIPQEAFLAIKLAATGTPVDIDMGRCNDRYFINIAAGGFGAQVTAETPPELKNFIGGSAYTLTGLLKVLNFTPFQGTISSEEVSLSAGVIVGVVCNGKQAGGGQQLAPNAKINDGFFDVMMLKEFPFDKLNQVIKEALNSTETGEFVIRFKTKKLNFVANGLDSAPLNLDGEPFEGNELEFEVVPKAIRLVLPDDCALLAV